LYNKDTRKVSLPKDRIWTEDKDLNLRVMDPLLYDSIKAITVDDTCKRIEDTKTSYKILIGNCKTIVLESRKRKRRWRDKIIKV
jgi:hypothetical protein